MNEYIVDYEIYDTTHMKVVGWGNSAMRAFDGKAAADFMSTVKYRVARDNGICGKQVRIRGVFKL